PSDIPQNWNYVDQSEYGYPLTWSGVLLSTSDNDSIASVVERGNDFVLGVNGAWLTDNAVIDNFEFSNHSLQWVVDAALLAEQVEPGNAIEESVYRGKLLDVQAFTNSIVSPPASNFNETMAVDGMRLFFGKGNCVSCHTSPEGTGRPDERFTHIVENAPQGLLASGIKVPGLRGLVLTAPYFHDGSAGTLADVVARYTSTSIPEVPSTLTFDEQDALVEYLKSL
ncbi:MAG: c-type cytochrome, partial [Arenicella sp.]|nr:c-type cytochrome [Arenicella sp.]